MKLKPSTIFSKKIILLPVAVASLVVTGSVFTFTDFFRPNPAPQNAPPQTKTELVKEYVVKETIDYTLNDVIEQVTAENGTHPGLKDSQIIKQVQASSSTLAEKERYLNSLAYVYELDTNAPIYEAWDYELNKIYGLLKEKLPAEKMAALKKDELAWIKFRDRQVGNVNTVEARTAKVTLTEERTLYLIDMYFDEPSHMRYVQLADETGNIRENPSIDSNIVFTGIMGDTFPYLQEKVNTTDGRTWYKVEYSSGLIGYISHAVSNLTNETPKYMRVMRNGTEILTRSWGYD